MKIKEFEVPSAELGYGFLKGQIFGNMKLNSKIILTIHGLQDNSNRFFKMN